MPPRLAPGLIVNADDLGIHPNINAGILSAYRNGILTSCTMLMTTEFLAETARDYVRPAELPIGIHLSLTLGKAVAQHSDVPDLIDEAGYLKWSAAQLILKNLNKNVLAQIEREFDAQLAMARDIGLRPTHADSHQHVHMNPAIFALVEKLLPRYGVKQLRLSRETFSPSLLNDDLRDVLKRNNPAKWALLRWRSRKITPSLATNDDFFGIMFSGIVKRPTLVKLLQNMPVGRSLEICLHPGFPAPGGSKFYPQPGYNEFICSADRATEHDILIDPAARQIVTDRGLILRSYDGRLKN